MTPRKERRRNLPPTAALLSLLAALPLASGCGFDVGYSLHAVFGQLNLLSNTVPVEEALTGGRLTADQQTRLSLVQDVRAFARDTIGLYVENSYAGFYDSGGRAVAYNVSASRKDAFEPMTWSFPFAGTIPQLGYFDRSLADAKVCELRSLGLDVFLYEIDAYYLATVLPNPATSTLLERDEIDLVATVIHELLHATVGRPNNSTIDVNFNESLATFVGRTGAQEYYEARFPDEPQRVQAAVDRFEDADRFDAYVLALYDELDAFYRSDLSSPDKIAGREAIFQAARDRFVVDVLPLMHEPELFDWVRDLPANNAYMLLQHRYNLDLAVFDQVFDAAGRRWPAALQVFRAAAVHQGDPFDYLRGWLASNALPFGSRLNGEPILHPSSFLLHPLDSPHAPLDA